MHLVPINGHTPTVHDDAWIAPGVVLIGDVHVGPQAGIWYGSVLRADRDRIEIGAGANVQDGCIVHADPGFPVIVGRGVSVGHRAVLHGCSVDDEVLVGMGAIVLNGARVGSGSVLGAGTVVRQGQSVPPCSLAVGVPSSILRTTTEAEREHIAANAATYRQLLRAHAHANGDTGSEADGTVPRGNTAPPQ